VLAVYVPPPPLLRRYVAEGDVAGTRIMSRVITNCGNSAASAMSGVLERAPRPSEATELPITVFYTPHAKVDFAGFVVEQVRRRGCLGGWASLAVLRCSCAICTVHLTASTLPIFFYFPFVFLYSRASASEVLQLPGQIFPH